MRELAISYIVKAFGPIMNALLIPKSATDLTEGVEL
jgi:hypothetical protein